MKTKNKSWFLPFDSIDDIFTVISMEKRYEMGVTIFYYDHENRDKEVTFFFNLN